MSFTDKAKDAICSTSIKKYCCKVSFLYGYLFSRDSFTNGTVEFSLRNRREAAFFKRIFFDVFAINLENSDKIIINDEYTVSLIYDTFMLSGECIISDIVYVCENCAQAFLRGVFLGCGTVSDPEKSYRMEFLAKNNNIQEALYSFLDWQGIPAKKYFRGNKTVLYYNNADKIQIALSYMGVGKVIFDFLNARMTGEERTNIIRKLNFETSNMNKTASATANQLLAIRTLEESGRLRFLPLELQYTAKLRAENPDASFSSLAAMHDPPITKSGLTHRLSKIIAFSKEET